MNKDWYGNHQSHRQFGWDLFIFDLLIFSFSTIHISFFFNDLNITLLTCPNLIQNIPLCHSNDKGKFPAPQDTEITDNPTAPLPQVEKNANVNQRSKFANPLSQDRPPL